jgi:hypothetical protein
MRARLTVNVIGEVAGQDAMEVSLVDDEHVIQTLAADRADAPRGERVLPWTLRRRANLLDPHAVQAMEELLTVDPVTIPEEICRRGLLRERFDKLLSRPGGGGMLGDVEVDDAPAVVSEQDEDEEDPGAAGGSGEKVDRDQVADVVGEKRPPGLRGAGAAVPHEPGDGALRNRDAKLQELSVDARAPRRGFAAAILRIRAAISASRGGRPPV